MHFIYIIKFLLQNILKEEWLSKQTILSWEDFPHQDWPSQNSGCWECGCEGDWEGPQPKGLGQERPEKQKMGWLLQQPCPGLSSNEEKYERRESSSETSEVWNNSKHRKSLLAGKRWAQSKVTHRRLPGEGSRNSPLTKLLLLKAPLTPMPPFQLQALRLALLIPCSGGKKNLEG